MTTLEKNKLIAQFMGWYIETEVSADYPTQEWHTTKQKGTGDWDTGQCVHLNKHNVESKRQEIDNHLWASLCTSSRAQYNKSWYKLMQAVEKLAKQSVDESLSTKSHNTLQLGYNHVNNTYYATIFCRKKDKSGAIVDAKKTSSSYMSMLEATFNCVVQCIKYLND